MILMQYYNFLNFGRTGYQKIMDNCLDNTAYFVEALHHSAILSKYLKNISDCTHLPIVVLTWADTVERPSWNLSNLSDQLRQCGWVVPSYVLPQLSPEQNLSPQDGVQVLRIVIQQVVTRDKLSKLISDMESAITQIEGVNLRSSKRELTCGYRC